MNSRALWNKWRPRIRPLMLMIVCLLILAGHEVFDYVWIDDPAQESDPGLFMNYLYLHLADLAFHFHKDSGTLVTIVRIDPDVEPAELLTNTCPSRGFIAQLVKDIIPLHPKAIVIDKFYSDISCPEDDTFRRALNDNPTKVPIVVGRPTHSLKNAATGKEGCLALSGIFNFSTDGEAKPSADGSQPAPRSLVRTGQVTSQVKYGLTRLNSDVLKIPRNWHIYNESSDSKCDSPNDQPGAGDSLSLVAVTEIEQVDSALTKAVEAFRSLKSQPYTNFRELPWINAIAVRCMEKLDPPPNPPFACDKIRCQCVDLNGKVVVIGEISDRDMHPFPGGRNKQEIAGVELQANYIKSILDQRFLREIPLWPTLFGLVVYIIAVYRWHFVIRNPEHAEIKSLGVLLLLILTILIILVAFHYYTPLWAISCAAIFVVFRYFETKAHHYSDQVKGEGSHPGH